MANLQLLVPYNTYYKSLPEVQLPDCNIQWEGTNPKVIFLDIDETMVHCVDDRDPAWMKGEYKLHVKMQDQSLEIDVNLRPGLIECLQELSQSYQIVSFTASD